MTPNKKLLVKLTVSLISFIIIVIFGNVPPLDKLKVSFKSYKNAPKTLKNFLSFMGFFGTLWPNLIVITLWIALFKRRQQAFSYTILLCAQIFFSQFFKLIMHNVP